jgi:hypothetical protein
MAEAYISLLLRIFTMVLGLIMLLMAMALISLNREKHIMDNYNKATSKVTAYVSIMMAVNTKATG